MENVWLQSAIWLGLAFAASIISIRIAMSVALLPRFAPWFFGKVGHRISKPESKFVSLILLSLGGLASVTGSEAVLPTCLVGMALAPAFLSDPELPKRMRGIAFTLLRPFYFLKAGSLVGFHAVMAALGLILVLLLVSTAEQNQARAAE